MRPSAAADPDDPQVRRSPLAVRFFTGAVTRRMAQNFAGVRVSRAAGPPPAAQVAGRSLVVYANHPSWWDPVFLIVLITRAFPDRRVFAPIDAEALGRYGFMRRCGLFGIEPDSRAGALRFLKVGRDVLSRPDTILCVTPQGRFSDVRQPLVLQRGLAVLLARAPEAVILPVALDYPFWNESRPEALARWGAPVACAGDARRDVEARQSALGAGLEKALAALENEAVRRDPAAFVSLLEGRVGVGGLYDAGRRLAAWTTGRRFDAAHGAGDRSRAE